LRESRRLAPDLPVLLLTAYGTIQDAVGAMREGAFDYLTKPVDKETLLRAARKALQVGDLKRENRRLREHLELQHPLDALIGSSTAMEATRALIRKAGPTEATVLLTGESGTGKELAAKALHALSRRADGPFVALNCAALAPELLESELFGHAKGSFTGAVGEHPGKFRLAHGGTLLLDEIGDMDPRLQAKILRTLQERVVDPVGATRPVPVDVRLIAATNRDLLALVASGTFREDLYFRLAVLTIRVPPLREREGDILLLMKHFYRQEGGGDLTLAPAASALLEAYAWPGNVRELANLCQRLAILHPRQRVTEELLPLEIGGGVGAGEAEAEGGHGLWDQERAAILKALTESGGNRSAAARALKVPRHILLYRMKKYGLGEG
jgi:two-component system NtrC family response regulator